MSEYRDGEIENNYLPFWYYNSILWSQLFLALAGDFWHGRSSSSYFADPPPPPLPPPSPPDSNWHLTKSCRVQHLIIKSGFYINLGTNEHCEEIR